MNAEEEEEEEAEGGGGCEGEGVVPLANWFMEGAVDV